MAFYIDLDKLEHTNEYVRYKFYDMPDNVGIIEFNFLKEEFKEILPAPNDPSHVFFDRAAMKIIKHWRTGEFPEKTCWAS
ncbi:MAG: hypothetical protein ACKOAD_03870 [Gammaproteobacteria bacterium]